jgi:hypothetical protein
MRIGLLVACLLLASVAGAKDLVVRQRSSTTLGGPASGEETVYLTAHTIVTDSAAMRTIVDLDKKTMTSADKTNRTYNVLTLDELRAQVDALRAALDQMPPEARKQVGALLDDDNTPVTIKATGKTETIAGYPAKEYELSGGPYKGSVWTTEALERPPAFEKWKEIDESRGGAARRLGEAMSKAKGFPLRTHIETQTGSRPFSLSNEVLDVKEGGTPPDMLRVPPGFTKQAAGAVPAPGGPARQ